MSGPLYLTIDDSPSAETPALADFLQSHGIQALLFCRGDRLQEYPDQADLAIRAGMLLGNHGFSHKRASTLTFAEATAEISRTETLIDAAYSRTGMARPGRWFRFPHMDRGTAGWIVDYDRLAERHRDTVIALFRDGLNITLDPPTQEMLRLKSDLQAWLADCGFQPLPCPGVTFPWFVETELGQAVDAMFTFSTSDWMITPRHAGRWPYAKLEDLKAKIDGDPHLNDPASANIVLAHDQPDLLLVVRELILHMIGRGSTFGNFGNG